MATWEKLQSSTSEPLEEDTSGSSGHISESTASLVLGSSMRISPTPKRGSWPGFLSSPNAMKRAIVVLYILFAVHFILWAMTAVSQSMRQGNEARRVETDVNGLQENMTLSSEKYQQLPAGVIDETETDTFESRSQNVYHQHSDVKSLFSFTEELNSTVLLLLSQFKTLNDKTENLSDITTVQMNMNTAITKQSKMHIHQLQDRLEGVEMLLQQLMSAVQRLNQSYQADIASYGNDMLTLNSMVANVTYQSMEMKQTQKDMQRQLKNEMEILKKVTEDVRLNNWEHSIKLQNITILTGPPGPKGNQGDVGHTGAPGMPGSKGERGFTGFLGLSGQKGYPGEKGDIGPRGPPGLPGTPGVWAEKGMSGEKGAKGDKGDKGDPDDGRVPVVRLVGGRRSNEGRVEVLHDGQWGTICNDNWNVQNANVVCKMLGYKSASASATIVSPYGQGSGPIWMDEVECSSTETDIRKCKFIGWGNHNCQHSEDVGVACVPL